MTQATDLITVPDLSAAELVAKAKRKLRPTVLSPNLTSWDFIRDERGKTYEVQVWKPGRAVVPAEEVRPHFTDGFTGNTAAFVAWVTKNSPLGFFASIPEDERLFRGGEYLRALSFGRDGGYRMLRLYHDVRGRWKDASWSFAAFREVK